MGKKYQKRNMREARINLIRKIVDGVDEVTLRRHYGFTIKSFEKFKEKHMDEIWKQNMKKIPEFEPL
jgi:hypothetical protein